MTLIIGVDPGKTGGIAVLHEGRLLDAFRMPLTADGKQVDAQGVRDLLDAVANPWRDVIVLEKVHAMPKNGSIASFSLGHSVGVVVGVALGAGYRLRLIAPAEWKKIVGIPAGSDKGASRAKASELFPDKRELWKLKKDDGLAEAALIAEASRVRDAL
jgi:crossover junction endodeoxyribonuclease RuvC